MLLCKTYKHVQPDVWTDAAAGWGVRPLRAVNRLAGAEWRMFQRTMADLDRRHACLECIGLGCACIHINYLIHLYFGR